MKSHLRVVTPTTEKRTVDAKGGRKPNSEYRTREYLTEASARPWLCPSQQGPRHPGHCRLISATRTSSTRCAIPSWRRTGSRTFGAKRQWSGGCRGRRSMGRAMGYGRTSLGQSTRLLSIPRTQDNRRLLLPDKIRRRPFRGCKNSPEAFSGLAKFLKPTSRQNANKLPA
jgi:hypothetical protein